MSDLVSNHEPDTEVNGTLSHEEALGLLDALADGELDDSDATKVRTHVADCVRCQRIQKSLDHAFLKEVLSEKPESQPETILPEVQRKIRLRSRGRFYANPKTNLWPILLGIVAVLALLIASYFALGRMDVR